MYTITATCISSLFEICFAAFADESKHLLLLLKIVQPRALIKLHEERVKAGNRDNPATLH